MGLAPWCLGIVLLAASIGCNSNSSSAASRRTERIEVRCTNEGIVVEGDTVAASADGVHIPVTNTTGGEARLVVGPVSENPTHTVSPGRSTVVVLARPGKVQLSCGPHNEAPRNPAVEITVIDPDGFYRSVNLPETLGCEPDQYVDGDPPGWGATAREAAEAFVAQLEAEATIADGNGYRDHDRKEFLLYIEGTGYGTLDAYPDVHPELGSKQYRAALGIVCSAREWPGYKPGTVGGDG